MFTWTVTRTDRTAEAKARMEAAAMLRVRSAAEFALERARITVPVDTGTLKASLHVFPGADGKTWSIVAATDYAAFVEFGTVRDGRAIPANPFLQRAILEARRAYPDLYWGPVTTSRGGLGMAIRAQRRPGGAVI